MNKTFEHWLGLDALRAPQDRELALMLYGVGFSTCLTAAAGIIVSIFGGFVNALKFAEIGFVITLILLAPVRAGYFKLASALYPAVALITFAVIAYQGAGLYDELIFGFYAAIAMAGLLLRRRGVVIFTGLSMVAVLLIGSAHSAGLILKYDEYYKSSRAALLCVMIALGGALIYLIINNLVASITRLSEKEQSLAESNQELLAVRASLESQVTERTRAAESARAESEAARRDAEFQAWSTRGHAQLSEQMRGELDLPTLANNVTSHLSQYIGAQTGALFVASSDVLKLIGRYAYVERAGQKNEFRIGENLIGEAAKSKRIILVNLPADTPLIFSALGEALPRQILIAPLESNGQNLGVIEFATLAQFTSEHEAFLKRVSESIAIALLTAQTRVQVNELLMRSQQQAEELQAQEEELRASNEELQAQAETRRVK